MAIRNIYEIKMPATRHWTHREFDVVDGFAKLCGCRYCERLQSSLKQVYLHHKEHQVSSIFDVSVPDAELEAPAFEPIPTGAYRTTLQAGAELAQNASGWKGIRLPFQGFRDAKTGQEFQRALRAQFTYEHSNPKAVQIGYQGIIGAAAALGLTEPTIDANGKPSQKLVATSMEELVSQFNQMAGTEVEVYVTVQERKKNGQVVTKQDGKPFLDNEIKRISAVKAA